MNYLKKISGLGRTFYPSLTWKIKTSEKILFLTFDDGPFPEITSWVLKELEKYKAKAVFFCIGENLEKYPEFAKKIVEKGHKIGNHTYNHLNGWEVGGAEYLENTEKCEMLISQHSNEKLFRPPYGRISRSQIKLLQNKDYKISMWDVISGDFDTKITSEKCYQNVIRNAEKGSIVVFHDSQKAFSHLQETLPRVLKYYSEKGFRFKAF